VDVYKRGGLSQVVLDPEGGSSPVGEVDPAGARTAGLLALRPYTDTKGLDFEETRELLKHIAEGLEGPSLSAFWEAVAEQLEKVPEPELGRKTSPTDAPIRPPRDDPGTLVPPTNLREEMQTDDKATEMLKILTAMPDAKVFISMIQEDPEAFSKAISGLQAASTEEGAV